MPKIKKVKIDTDLPVQKNLYDRIYVAIYTVYGKNKSFVYTLTEDYNGMGYEILPNVNVATFKTRKDADDYHDYIEKIMIHQDQNKAAVFLREQNTENRSRFFDMILSMKMGIKILEKQK